MDRFDYKVSGNKNYVSTGLTPGDVKKPVAWGSKTSFSEPLVRNIGSKIMQVIVEPIYDNVRVISCDSLDVDYIRNGVYVVHYDSRSVRVVASTGPVVIKVGLTDFTSQVTIDGVRTEGPSRIPDSGYIGRYMVKYQSGGVSSKELTISPEDGVLYDKFILDHEGAIEELVTKKPMTSLGPKGRLSTLSYDKLCDPVLVTIDEMQKIEGYRASTRKLTEANTSVVFYSDTDQIEKSYDGSEWLPVDKVEFHGEQAMIFRSKDENFALRYYDTTIDSFIVRGAKVTADGPIYKIGDDIGSYFSHDSYYMRDGSLTVDSSKMESLSVLGLFSDDVLENHDYQIDRQATNLGKMHLYTFHSEGSIKLEGEDMYFAAMGINLDHESTMNHITGVSEISYADEIEDITIGQSINGDSEYAILDLQWNV